MAKDDKSDDTWVSKTITGPDYDQSVPQKVEKDRCLVTVLTGPDPGSIFALDEEEITVGRDESVTAQLSDPALSRRHARIFRDEAGRFLVEDLGSKNGTYVRGERIAAPTALEDGERIGLGSSTELRFSVADMLEEETILRLRDAGVRDGLTGVYNRRYLMERLATEMAFGRRHDMPVAVLLLDLDHFKAINDEHGHAAGDEVLKAVVRALQSRIRCEDIIGRYGGEEFMVIARGSKRAGGVVLARRLRSRIERTEILHEGATMSVTVSIGVAAMEPGSMDAHPDALIQRADAALYEAKKAGRNIVKTG